MGDEAQDVESRDPLLAQERDRVGVGLLEERGEQVAGLPSLCAPQQSLFEVPPTGGQVTLPDDIVSVSDGWIDTVALFRDAL